MVRPWFTDIFTVPHALADDAERDCWTYVASMTHLRSDAKACTVGGALYIAGGFDGIHILQTAERLDPREGRWAAIPEMSVKRSGVTVVNFYDTVWAIGGYDGNIVCHICYILFLNLLYRCISIFHIFVLCILLEIIVEEYTLPILLISTTLSQRLDSVEVFEPRANAWRLLTCNMKTKRSNFAASVIGEGSNAPSVMACGGFDGNTNSVTDLCERFIPRGSSEYKMRHWSPTGYYHHFIKNRDIYSFDWYETLHPRGRSPYASTPLPDGEWVDCCPMPTARSALCNAVVHGIENISDLLYAERAEVRGLDDWLDKFQVPPPHSDTEDCSLAREWDYWTSPNASIATSSQPPDGESSSVFHPLPRDNKTTRAPPSATLATSSTSTTPPRSNRGGNTGSSSNSPQHVASSTSSADAMVADQ